MIDFSKPVKTKSGYEVVNITVKHTEKEAFVVHGTVIISKGHKKEQWWTIDGKKELYKPSVWDLTN